jgi:hypothetical protein
MKVRPGDAIRIRELVTIDGDAVAVPDPYRLTPAVPALRGLPNLQCASAVGGCQARRDHAAAIHEVVLFHSTPPELRSYAGDLPLDVVADPNKQL